MSEPKLEAEDVFFTLRSRAYALADSGRYKAWNHVAYALLAEGFQPAVIKRFDADGLAVMMVTRSCKLAGAAPPAAPSRLRTWFASLMARLS